MIRKPYLAILLFFALCLLQGCIIVIQQPSAEEKQLMTIQDKVVDQISSINQRINSGNYSKTEINELLTSAQQVLEESLQNLESLKLSEKMKDVANQTKNYLESAKGLYADMQKFIDQLDELKKQSLEITTQAQVALNEQMKNAQKGLDIFKKQLDQLSSELIDTKNIIEKQYQQL